MKQLLRFKTFLLMAVISLLAGTSAWAQSDFSATETSNVTLTAGTNGSTCTVNGKDGIKVGTSKAGGDMSVTVPAGTTHLHVHAAAWKGVTGLSLNISGATTSPSSVDLTADSGVSNNSPFTLSGSASSYYFVVELSNITAETTLKFTSSTGKRFVVWGVNAESVTSGGPTLTDNDLALTGAPIALSFDLYNNSDAQVINYTTSSTGAVSIANNSFATFSVDQDNKTITVTPTAVTPSAQTITVNQAADDTYKAGSVTFTINVTNSNPAVNNISDITAAGTYKVRGTIVAKSQRGFIVGDGTGYVYYYNQNYTQADYNIGDMVELSGSVVAYGGVFEFNNTTTVTAATSSNYVAENPTVLSGADMDTRVASTTPTQLSSYVQYEGTLTVSGTYYNITSIDGASTAMGSISYPLNTDFTSLNGKKVKVTGYYVGISSSKYYNTMIGSIEEVVVTTPTLTVEPAVVNVPYTGGNGDFTVSPSNVDNAFGAYITYYDPANTENTASSDPEWLNVGYDYSNLSLSYSVTEENTTGAARTACFKYSVMCDGGVALSNMITVTQAAYIADYATLPFTFDGGRADIETTAGLTQEGLDSDYASSPKLKFNGTGDYVILKFNERPGTLTFDIKGNSFSGGTFTVQTSEDGVTYTDLETYDALADMQSEELNNLGEGVRYIKWVYTNKSSGNVALGNIALAKYSAPAPSITISPDSYTMDAKAGGGELPVTCSNMPANPQLEVLFYESDGTTSATYDWISATINANGNIDGQIQENTGAARTAYFKVHGVDADNNDVYSNLVTFTQEAPVAATPTIVFNPESIDFDANSGYRTIGGDYFECQNFDGTPSLEILFYESDGETSAAYDWITASFNADGKIDFVYNDNTGAARTAYLKIHAVGTTVYSNLFTVNQAAAATPDVAHYYQKVSSSADLTNGDYLIVCEEGNVAFNGGLETLDAASNTIEVKIADDKIASSETVDAAVFTIDTTAGTLLSASGLYIGQTTDGNGMKSSAETPYKNTLQVDTDGNADIASAGAYLRYNAASNQERFRYYKSSSYTGQKVIQLYKRMDGEMPAASPALAVTPDVVTVPYTGGAESFTVTPSNVENAFGGYVTFYDPTDTETTVDQPKWIGISYDYSDMSLSYTITDENNTGAERTACFKYVIKCDNGEAMSNLVTVKQEAYVAPVASIAVDPNVVNATFAATEGTIAVTYANFTAANPGIELFEADGATPATYDWLTASFDDDATIVYTIQENTTTEARTAYFKAYAMNGETKVYSDLVTVAQEGVVVDYATLPFTFDGGRADIEGTNGFTHENLGSDYSSAPKLKFDSTGDVLVLKFNERPGKLTFDIKGNSFSGGTFTVQTSEDGVNYTDLKTYTELGATQSEMFNTLGENVRYIKWVYTEKSSGNVALGNIALKKYTDTPVVVVAAPTFDPAGMEVEAGFVVTITSEVGTVISYTTDGTDPAESATAVLTDTNTASVEVNADMTIRAIALDNDLNQSVEVSESYTVAAPVVVVGVPVITVDNGLITIIPGSDNAQVIYTTDGTDPTNEPLNGTVYTEPFNITVDTTIKAIGVDNNGNVSEVVTTEASAEVVVGVKYYKVTSTDQLEEGVDYLLVYEGVAGEGAAAYGGLNSYTTNSIGKSVALKHIGGSVVTITDEEVVPVTLKSRSEDGTKWAMRDANGWIAAVNGNNLHGDKTEDDAVWTFDFTADANKQIFHEFTGSTTSTRYLQYNTSSPRFAGYTGSQSAVCLYKAATYNVSVGATGYATLYYGTKNLVVPENVEAYTYTVNNGKLEESYLYSTNEVIPAGTGVVLKAPAGEYKFAVTTEAGLEDTDNLLFGFDEASTTVAPAAGDYLFYLLGVDNGKVGFYWGKAKGAAFTSGAHKAYLAVPTEQASGLRGFSFDGSVVGINTIGVDMPEGNAYDLQGRRVQQFQKNGLYIVDGKKVLAK